MFLGQFSFFAAEKIFNLTSIKFARVSFKYFSEAQKIVKLDPSRQNQIKIFVNLSSQQNLFVFIQSFSLKQLKFTR